MKKKKKTQNMVHGFEFFFFFPVIIYVFFIINLLNSIFFPFVYFLFLGIIIEFQYNYLERMGGGNFYKKTILIK